MDINPKLIHYATTKHSYVEVEQWCLENVGEWNIDWYKLGIDPMQWIEEDPISEYYFADEKSAVLFKLKWS
jgi:hypothetical protein